LDSQRHKMPQKVTFILTPAPLKYCSQETMKHKKESTKKLKSTYSQLMTNDL